MTCHYHADREAVGACVNCGHLVCGECRVVLGGRVYCNPCADALVTGTVGHSSLSWFERHLNWTMFFGLLGAYLAVFIAVFIIVLADPYASDDIAYVIGIIISLAVLIPVWGWALRRKNRSLWWLPLGLFVPFGFIVLLCLENKSQLSRTPELQG